MGFVNDIIDCEYLRCDFVLNFFFLRDKIVYYYYVTRKSKITTRLMSIGTCSIQTNKGKETIALLAKA